MDTKSFIAILIVLILIAGGVWAYSVNRSTPPPDSLDQSSAVENGTASTPTGDTTASSTEGGGVEVGVDVAAGSSPMSAMITLTSSGFSPKSVTIKKGGTVTWTNQGSGQMWVASAQHPTHTTYSGTTLQQHCGSGETDAFDQCSNGNTYSFTFDKVGTWNYHNHSNASQFGTVVVIE